MFRFDPPPTPAQQPTPNVTFTYDPQYNRIATVATAGIGTQNYKYYPILSPPTLGAGQLYQVFGLLANDTITYKYDELGRRVSEFINGDSSPSVVSYDSLGRVSGTMNPLGNFTPTYDGPTIPGANTHRPKRSEADF